MPILRHPLFNPLNLAALLTIAAVAASLRGAEPALRPWAWLLLGTFTLAHLSLSVSERPLRALVAAALLLMPACALALLTVAPRSGTAPVLLVIWTAAMVADWPARVAFMAAAVVAVAFYGVLRWALHWTEPLLTVVIYSGFQAFAALCMHYARSAEAARDALARVNADLLATRALLADSARDAERLRLARELHDVAGHKLTAMRLNLRALAADPALAAREEVRIASDLSAELLGDIRDVVQALRDARGLDLGTALRALAAPLPRPALALSIDDDVQVSDPAIAEALLRLVQEALTNSARHGQATTLRVALSREGERLRLAIEDDGRVRPGWREGSGIAGMRERIDALHGEFSAVRGASGALRIDASLPA